MSSKKSSLPKENRSLSSSLGIPDFLHVEKLTEVIPVKVGISLKKAIPKPQSSWIRELIVRELTREAEET